MNPKILNSLKLYTQSVNESYELAEKKANEFIDKFNKLDKYDQLCISIMMETNEWTQAFEQIDELQA